MDAALELVRRWGAAAQLCVIQDGRVVIDEAVGCTSDSLFWIFSTSKPYVALLVHRLAERGALSPDEPVAAYWPEFAERGKGGITVRQVLQHRAGLPVARSVARDALAMTDWRHSVRALERARPRYAPGEVPAYHLLSYGFLLGEVASRVGGAPVEVLLRRELLDPLRLTDTHLGLPDRLWPRRVPVRGMGAARVSAAYVNRRATRRAVVPAAGVSATARDVARFYRMLLDGGTLDGVRVLAPETIQTARRPSSEGEVDRFLRLAMRWSEGFQLGGPADDPASSRPMGRLSSPLTFGHNGSNCCLAWADPTRRLVLVYLTNLLLPGHDGARHQAAVSDAVLSAAPPVDQGPRGWTRPPTRPPTP
ncbi:serine hydrolase domain-containing protein [Phytohabitans houttuyneae]|uniref:Hydrolase n=1 Tax=Phytohabitans houttuyneae TaxID=1076126 RepID=A0A6V8K1E8_9ACTN|nr:serine hydrolase domain-containing protein [Phytohabitans houttuyneae]GFJ75989.1 hydrolase [Phytohabitans houttuyneae]